LATARVEDRCARDDSARIHHRLTEAELHERPDAVGRQADAGAERREVAGALEHCHPNAAPAQRNGQRQAADPGAGNGDLGDHGQGSYAH